MSYNGSGTFVINSTGQPVVTGTVISSSTFNSLTADLGTGLSTAITKDGQTTTTAKIPFAQGLSAAVASNFAAGTVGAPSIYLSTDTTTGLYRIGANNVGFAVSGVKLLDLGSALVGVTGALTVSTTLGVTGTSTLAAVNASALLSIDSNTNAFSPLLNVRNGNGGTSARVRASLGNDESSYGLTIEMRSTTYTGATRSAQIMNQQAGILELGSNGIVTLTSNIGGTGITIPGTLTNSSNISVNGSGALYNLINLKDTVDQSGATYVQFLNSTGGGIGSITRVTTTNAVTYNTTSDYRLKNNQAPLVGSGKFIDALKPKTWEWAENGIKASGFIAHEFAEVSPSSVSGEKDETEEEEYEVSPAIDATFDEDGNELTPAVAAVKATRTVPLYQGMQASSSEVIANLVAEIQSLRSRVALLETK